MTSNWIGAVIAFLIGIGIAAVCYGISRTMLLRHPKHYAAAEILRRLLQIGYLVALFCLGSYTPWDKLWLVIGGGLGLTLPMIFFIYRLVKLNDTLDKKEDSSNG